MSEKNGAYRGLTSQEIRNIEDWWLKLESEGEWYAFTVYGLEEDSFPEYHELRVQAKVVVDSFRDAEEQLETLSRELLRYGIDTRDLQL